jgi:putative membrane protein
MKKSYWIAVSVSAIIFLIVLLVGTSLLGGWNNRGWGMMGGWPAGTMHGWGLGSFGWFGMILMWLIPVGFVALVVLGIVGLIRGFSSTGEGSPIINQREEAQNSPRDILQFRYAGGEITREQYLQILDDIN